LGLMDEISRISKLDAEKILSPVYDPLKMTEYEIVKEALVAMSKFQIGEREIRLPGFNRNLGLLLQCVADFKDKVKRPIMPPEIATADMITVEPLRPEVFGLDTYKRTGLTVGTYHIIPTAVGTWSATKDEEVVVITDWIEFLTPVNVTAIQAADLDGEVLKPEEIRLNLKASDLHIFELKRPWICDITLDVDGKVEVAGDSELTPFGVHICLGKQLPALT